LSQQHLPAADCLTQPGSLPEPGSGSPARPERTSPEPDEPTAGPTDTPAEPAEAGRRGATWEVAGVALCLVAVIALGFVVDLLILGALRHNRDQQTRYADFRYALANGTAPVGQADQDGRLLPLGTPVAVLTVPQIGLREVVLEGTTAGVLRGGPGHLRDTVLPGQAGTSVIMGRRGTYGGPFRHLDQLRAGDTFTVTTGQGDQQYRVLDLRRAGDPVPAPPTDGAGRLVLTTTDGSSLLPNGVLRVDADLTSGAQPTPARMLDRSARPPAEQPMGTDRSVWVPLVFWAQALLLAAAVITWSRLRWGRWQSWIVGVPVLAALGLAVADQAVGLLPNLI
jgi:sortase A